MKGVVENSRGEDSRTKIPSLFKRLQAFEVNSFDEIMTGGQYMLERGAESVSGPGRHSLGSNCFWYFKNPCGGDIEYFADMDRLDDSWEPRYWEESPPYARWMVGEDILTG